MDAGLVDHYEKKHFEAARLSKCDAEQKEGNQLGYFKLATLFFILAIGMLFSSLAFLYELCCRQFQKNSSLNDINMIMYADAWKIPPLIQKLLEIPSLIELTYILFKSFILLPKNTEIDLT